MPSRAGQRFRLIFTDRNFRLLQIFEGGEVGEANQADKSRQALKCSTAWNVLALTVRRSRSTLYTCTYERKI
jgi:hypothetical protein